MNNSDKNEDLVGHLLDSVKDKERARKILDELMNNGNWTADDPVFVAASTIETVKELLSILENIINAVPNGIKQAYLESVVDLKQLLEELKEKEAAIARKKGARDTTISPKLIWVSIGISSGSMGIVIGFLVAMTIIFPKQLSIARGNDGALMDWLSTPQGELMRRSYASGNKSVDLCVKKAATLSKKKGSNKLQCTIDLQ
jgi:hypothetical protein